MRPIRIEEIWGVRMYLGNRDRGWRGDQERPDFLWRGTETEAQEMATTLNDQDTGWLYTAELLPERNRRR